MGSANITRARFKRTGLVAFAQVLALGLAALPVGCSSEAPSPPVGSGGAPTGSGGAGTATGGSSSGGSTALGNGGSQPQSGGAQSGGASAVAGSSAAGASSGGAGGLTSTSGGAGTKGGATGSGGSAASGGSAGAGGSAGGSGGSSAACTFSCVDACAAPGTTRTGSCEGTKVCCEAAQANPLAHLQSSAKEVGLLLANRFRQQALAYTTVKNLPGDGYKNACEWYGALGVAKSTNSTELLSALVSKFDSFKPTFVADMTMPSGVADPHHVDRYIYGAVPLEIYLQTKDMSFLPLGTQVADKQQTTNQVRNAIDDMFMMTILQIEAYRATKEAKYIDFMAKTMVDYLKAQQSNGLFFHNVNEAKVHWGRGNGWFAAGMAEMIRDLPTTHTNYAAIESGYKKMMAGLVPFQKNGLWYQVLDMPNNTSNWQESSGSAMFTYAMIAGVRRGLLDAATYVPVIESAWTALRGKINAQGAVSDICIGTWYKASAQEYMALTKLTGDGHGQAPVLWAAAELLR